MSGFSGINKALFVFLGSCLQHRHRVNEKRGGRRNFREWALLYLWRLQRKYGGFLVTWHLTP